MIDYIKGDIAELTPTYVVLEAYGVGYMLSISLATYSELLGKKEAKLLVHEAIREDAYSLFGFLNQEERQIFLLLISVSGVGANTARVILSSLSTAELKSAILTGNAAILKSVKGIGAKTAERIIIDTQDKIAKINIEAAAIDSTPNALIDNSIAEEAVTALVMLGFAQSAAQKVVKKVIEADPQLRVEQIIKQALKML